MTKQSFAAMILGGTGQVGGAVVAELLAIPECREVVMVTRKAIAARSRVRNVILGLVPNRRLKRSRLKRKGDRLETSGLAI